MNPPGDEPVIDQSMPATAIETRRRWPLVVGIVVAVVVLVVVGGIVGQAAFYGRTFDRLVETTRTAEGDPIWNSFFVAQDCFVSAVVDEADAELAFSDGLTLLDRSDLLARHVETSLGLFADVTILPFHSALSVAREAISAHYLVWRDHLQLTNPILSALDPDPTALGQSFQAWVDLVASDGEAIETTFIDAEAAFTEAARDDPARLAIDTLFTPSEVTCSRGAV